MQRDELCMKNISFIAILTYYIIYMKMIMMSALTYLMTSLGDEFDSEPKATNDLSPQTRLEHNCHRTVKPNK